MPMLNKIFLAFFVLALIGLAALTFLANSQLQSIGFAPATVVENFNSYFGFHWTYFWITSVVLLIFANVIMWTTRKAWPLWLTFVFFSVSMLSSMWWLSSQLFSYKKQNGLWQGGFDLNLIGAAFFIIIAGIGIFFNQFITLRLRDKMFSNNENAKPTEQSSEQNTLEKNT